jgi:hypothetical protein
MEEWEYLSIVVTHGTTNDPGPTARIKDANGNEPADEDQNSGRQAARSMRLLHELVVELRAQGWEFVSADPPGDWIFRRLR